MKTSMLLLSVLLISTVAVFAQNEDTQKDEVSGGFTYGEFKAGYGITQFSSRLDKRFENGNLSTSGGGLYTMQPIANSKK